MAEIFDKMLVGFNRGVTNISANSKAIVDKAKANTAISTLEAERSKLYLLLGQKMHETYISTGAIAIDEALRNLLSEITQRSELIAQQQAQLDRIEEEVRRAAESAAVSPVSGVACTCGYTNPAGSKFCAGCGSVIETPQNNNVCPHCGGKVEVGCSFCGHCGGRVKDTV